MLRRPVVSACLLALAVTGLVAGCGPPEPRAPVTFVWPTTTARQDFLDTPFPSDVMIRADGRLDLRTFPNPFNSATLEDFLVIFETAPAYAASSTMYFRVEGGVDESTLPATAADSVAAASGLFVIELTGPHAGRRLPIEWHHYPDGTAFLPPGTVAVSLLLGAVPAGQFALVATSALTHTDGTKLGPSPDFSALMSCTLPADLDRPVDCAPYQALPAALGLDETAVRDIAVALVITPQDSSAGLVTAAATARAFSPTISGVTHNTAGSNAHYDRYDGVIALAQYQAGTPPFDSYDGESGGFILDASGAPVQQRVEDVPFVLTVPTGPMPATGWCVVVNGHGTGGDLESGVGTRAGDESFRLKEAGCAMMAISEPLHRTRAGHRAGQEETLTFNFFNPLAGRDNWRQSALEKVQQVTALQTLSFVGAAGTTVTMDPARIGYFGHSQGGIVGGLFVGVEERITGALLSGAGAGFAPSLIEKTDPIVIADVLKLVLQIPDEEPIDTFHPVPALLQTFVDAADPLNYGRRWRESDNAPHLLVTSGLVDTFTPPRNHAGLAGAFSLPQASPIAEQLEVLGILGVDDVADTVTGNLARSDGSPLTAALVQFPADGHFAIFQNPAAHQMFTHFFATMPTGTPTIRTSGP